MNKEISLKSFLIGLVFLSVGLIIIINIWFSKANPFCKMDLDNPCAFAICDSCERIDGKRMCSDCNIYNEDDDRIWLGGCVFDD